MDAVIQQKVNAWLEGNYDDNTKSAIRALESENQKELADSFYRNLEF